MRRILLLAVLGAMVAVPALRAQESADAGALRSVEDQLTQAYKQRQVEALASLLDEDFVITFEDGSTLSKTGYISFMASPADHVDVAEMSDLKIRMHGNTGVVIGVYHERGNTKGTPYDYHDRFTDVWMKTNGKWRLIASHYAVPVKQ